MNVKYIIKNISYTTDITYIGYNGSTAIDIHGAFQFSYYEDAVNCINNMKKIGIYKIEKIFIV